MPKYPATTATAKAAIQTAHRTRRGCWGAGAGTEGGLLPTTAAGGDAVGVAGGGGDVDCSGDVMMMSLLAVGCPNAGVSPCQFGSSPLHSLRGSGGRWQWPGVGVVPIAYSSRAKAMR